MTPGFVQIVTFPKHSIEFIEQERNSFVTFVALNHRVHVGTIDFDVSLGLESGGDFFLGVALQLHTDAHDALLVTKQSFGFLPHKRLERRREVEVDAGYDQFVVILSVHDAAFCLGFSEPGQTTTQTEICP